MDYTWRGRKESRGTPKFLTGAAGRMEVLPSMMGRHASRADVGKRRSSVLGLAGRNAL